MPEKQLDRVSYSFGMKINIGNYESADFHVSYSTDVKDGEDVTEAFQRAKATVEDEADKRYDELSALRKK